MKKLSIAVASVLAVAQVNAHAFEALANVVGVSPITEQVNRPTQQCWTETQQVTQAVPQERNYLGAIIGGVAGRFIGFPGRRRQWPGTGGPAGGRGPRRAP